MKLRTSCLSLIVAASTAMSLVGPSRAAEPIKVALVSRTLFNTPAWVPERNMAQLRGAHFGVYSAEEGTTYLLSAAAALRLISVNIPWRHQ